jgi:primosomal protein N' (replication factor Y)
MHPPTRRARRLRTHSTDAERRLWRHLRNRQVAGAKFRRQHPFPPYVVDFCCVERRLVVEVDGGQHEENRDRARTEFLQSKGFRVLRFWNNDVLTNTEGVLESILAALAGDGSD